MSVSFSSAPSYLWLNTWVLANIIELATQDFCNLFVNYNIDPARRLYDQMVMAARSIRANIAEGSGRHETSIETEMRLTDVARASAHELMGDYINYMMRNNLKAWEANNPRFQQVITMQLQKPNYSENFINDAMKHIAEQKSRFDIFLKHGSNADAANCLITLCMKINAMLTSMLSSQLRDFRAQGGFTENLTQTRLQARREQAENNDAPRCPRCGQTMLLRTTQRGSKQGQTFWGCSAYPTCTATLPVAK